MAKYIIKHKQGGYQVQIWNNGSYKYCGMFKTEELAIIERDKVLKTLGKRVTYESRYVDNREMMREVIISKATGKLSPKLLEQCMKIVKGVTKKFRYEQEEDRYDCEAYAYEVIIKNWYHFNEDVYENPFAYYTELVKRAFALQFKRLQKCRINTISLDYTNEDGKKMFNI
jgi:hypothetical protein